MIKIVPTEHEATLIKGEIEISFVHYSKQNIGFLPYKLNTPTLIDLVATSIKSFIFSLKFIPLITTILSSPIFNLFLAENSFFKSSS